MQCTTFTIHFATINTERESCRICTRLSFTIHFATINTMYHSLYLNLFQKFTIHFATINTVKFLKMSMYLLDLQYTLLLLIQFSSKEMEAGFYHLQYTLLLLIPRFES